MTHKPKKLSDTARALLTSAEMRDDHLLPLPRLPVAAARQVIRSLLNAGLAEEVPAPNDDAAYAWRSGDDGEVLMLRATELGLAGVAEREGTAAAPISTGATIEIAVQVGAPTGTDVAGAVTAAAPTTLDLVAHDAATVPASAHATGSHEAALTMPRRAKRADRRNPMAVPWRIGSSFLTSVNRPVNLTALGVCRCRSVLRMRAGTECNETPPRYSHEYAQ